SKQCTYIEFNTLEHIGRLLLFNRFKELSASNTISTDDEPYSGLPNPLTGLIWLAPAGELCSYLDDLAKSLVIQAYIRECSFGQPKIDSSHPDWSFN
ncbi:hypothetical protein HID58_046877, partial [Brassica napus]